jgi:protein O-mannosyl-transferase
MPRNIFICLALALLTWTVFGQTRHFSFINYDDPAYILQRPGLRDGLSLSGVQWAFTTAFGNRIPVTELSYLADYSIHGLDPGGYHVTNVLLHAANGLLLFLFLARTTRAPWPSAIVAALFLVHPLRAESVAWIASRKDLTCGLFWMLTLHAYASYARNPDLPRYLFVFLAVCLALMSKPMAVTLPCVLLLLDFWPLDRFDRAVAASASARRALGRLTAEKLPLFVPVLAASASTLVIQAQSGAVSSIERFPLGDRIGNAALSYTMYVVKTVLPVDLIPIYPFDTSAMASLRVAAFAIVAAGIVLTAAVLLAARRHRWIPVGWLWYLGTLVPVIGLVQVGAQSMADRYTYLPQIGLWLAVVWTLHGVTRNVPRARIYAAGCAIIAIACFAIVAHRQTGFWRDSLTLWRYTVGVSPENAIAHSLLGEAYLEAGRDVSARNHLEQAIALQAGHRPALLNLAKLDVQDGDLESAEARCRELVAVRSDDPDAHTTWASVLLRRNRPDTAMEHLDIALAADPDHPDALINRGAALLLLGRAPDAVAPLERAIRLAPDDPAAFTNLATTNFALGRYDDARRYCAEALRIDPEYSPALNLRGDLEALPSP